MAAGGCRRRGGEASRASRLSPGGAPRAGRSDGGPSAPPHHPARGEQHPFPGRAGAAPLRSGGPGNGSRRPADRAARPGGAAAPAARRRTGLTLAEAGRYCRWSVPPPSPSHAMTLAAGTPIGKYVVRRKLAEGGMAELYLAAARGPEGFEKDVVIKRVRPGLADDPGFVRMFIAEARVASRLNHANLVTIFDFDKHQDTYYLAMEYVRGHSLWELRRRCQERGVPVPPTLAAQIGMELARGLAYAHRLTEGGKPLELVHRDVTPHNVLLSFDGAVKLTDFGIAKAGGRSTASGVLKGKFAYMSPHQPPRPALHARTHLSALA